MTKMDIDNCNDVIKLIEEADKIYIDNDSNEISAFELYSKALDLDPSNGHAAYGIANCYLFEKGVEKNVEKAIEYYEMADGLGYYTATYDLGTIYMFGEEVEKDTQKAINLFKKAAEGGEASAATNLSVAYQIGDGVEKDLEESFEWAKKAAQLGETDRLLGFATDIFNGTEGFEEDKEKAVALFIELAEYGSMVAAENLGVCYSNGFGVKKDYYKAIEWYEEASIRGSDKALDNLRILYEEVYPENAEEKQFLAYKRAYEEGNNDALLGMHFYYRDGIFVDKDPIKAMGLLNQSIEAGNAAACNLVAQYYHDGLFGLPEDKQKAIEYWEKSVELGATGDPACNLGHVYRTGDGVPVDNAKAVEWYEKAKELNGNPKACFWLGTLYGYDVDGVEQDLEKSYENFELAYQAGLSAGALCLAEFYEKGLGAEQDDKKAFELYSVAAEGGEGLAMYKLFHAYGDGKGVGVDYDKAYEWLDKAVEAGYVEACESKGINCLLHENYAEAVRLFELADEKGSLLGTVKLAELLADGADGVSMDEDKAFALFQKAAEAGWASGQTGLARCYVLGKGAEADLDKALIWFKQAAEKGDVSAKYALAGMYESGIATDVDSERALQLYREVANSEHTPFKEDAIEAIQRLENETGNKIKTESELIQDEFFNTEQAEKFNNTIKAIQTTIGDTSNRDAFIELANETNDPFCTFAAFLTSSISLLTTMHMFTQGLNVFDYLNEEASNVLAWANNCGNIKNLQNDYKAIFEKYTALAYRAKGTRVFVNDPESSIDWFQKAVALNDNESRIPLTAGLNTRIDAETKKKNPNVERVYSTIREIVKILYDYIENFDPEVSSENDLGVVHSMLASYYENGIGVEQDLEKADYHRKQAEHYIDTTNDGIPNYGELSTDELIQTALLTDSVYGKNIPELAEILRSTSRENFNAKYKVVNNKRLTEKIPKLDKETIQKKSKEKIQNIDKEKIRKIKKYVAIACIVFVAVCFIGLAFKLLKPIISPFNYDNTASSAIKSATSGNGSNVAIQDGTVYYIKESSTSIEDEDGYEEKNADVALYSSDINGNHEDVIYAPEGVDEASLSISDNKAFIFEKLLVDYEVEDHQECRVTVIDLSSGDVIDSFQPDIIDVSRCFIIADRIVYKWSGWEGEDAIECISSTNLDGSDFKTIYESPGYFQYTWDDEKLYIADDYVNSDKAEDHVIFTLKPSGGEKEILFNGVLSDSEDEYWEDLFLTSEGLIQTEAFWNFDDDNEYINYELMTLIQDAGEMNVIYEWTQPEYSNASGSNAYANYYYFNYYNEKSEDYEIKRINLSSGDVEKVLDLPNVSYMEGPYVEMLLFDKYIILDMRELDFDSDSDSSTERNRIFIYDLNGKCLSEL